MEPNGRLTRIADVVLLTAEFCAFVTSRIFVALGMAVLIGWVAIGCP
jgi:hypothetical protein